jgi:hypothetical protein
MAALSPELIQYFQVNQLESLKGKPSSAKIQPVDSVGKALISTPETLKKN